MEIGKTTRCYTIEPLVEPVPVSREAAETPEPIAATAPADPPTPSPTIAFTPVLTDTRLTRRFGA